MNVQHKPIFSTNNFLGYLSKYLLAGLLTIVSVSLHAGIVGSRHDLSPGGLAQSVVGSTEVCVFCHTPHGSDTSAAVPLWNKVLPNPTVYDTFRYSYLGTSSLDGTEAPVGSVSLACLSCHDGVQGMDVVINAPGSTATNPALYNAAGIPLNGTVLMTGAPVPMLGTDLRDDHPISIQYAGGGCDSTNADGVVCPGPLGDVEFNAPFKDTINGNPVWWVDDLVGTAGIREREDMHLYTRDIGGVVQPLVECGSCHDPHNQSTFSGGAGTESVAFLRVSNAASVICTTCHVK